ncbi:hypothetical protein ACFL0C_02125 [Patescibacteria group bacterium]
MNSSTQAQKGFKTFLLTLVISLVVFSAIYYIINSGGDSPSSYKDSTDDESSFVKEELTSPDKVVVDTSKNESVTLGDSSKRSVFGELAAQPVEEVDAEPRQVLAGADVTTEEVEEVSETTVPETGIFSPTIGLVLSTIALSIGAYLVFLGPRKLALSSFEKKVLDDLEK